MRLKLVLEFSDFTFRLFVEVLGLSVLVLGVLAGDLSCCCKQT